MKDNEDDEYGSIVENPSDIRSFANWLKHIIALNNSGVVYSWGLNNYGQLTRDFRELSNSKNFQKILIDSS